jgi:hypothetical protein
MSGYDLDVIYRAMSDYAYAPPAPEECLVFDTYVAAPTWSLVGTGTNGTVTLSSDAPAGDASNFNAIVLLVAHCENKGANNAGNAAWNTVSDDGSTTAKSIYQADGSDCFDTTWRTFDPGHVFASSDDWGPYSGLTVQMWGGSAMRNLTADMLAGDTITYDIVNNHSSAKAYLVENMAPYYIKRTNNASDDISLLFYEGALAVVVTYGYDARAADCLAFLGSEGGGGMTTAAGTSVLSVAAQSAETAWHGPPCVSSNVNIDCQTDVRLVSIPSGVGTYNLGATRSPALGTSGAYGAAFPGQGTF